MSTGETTRGHRAAVLRHGHLVVHLNDDAGLFFDKLLAAATGSGSQGPSLSGLQGAPVDPGGGQFFSMASRVRGAVSQFLDKPCPDMRSAVFHLRKLGCHNKLSKRLNKLSAVTDVYRHSASEWDLTRLLGDVEDFLESCSAAPQASASQPAAASEDNSCDLPDDLSTASVSSLGTQVKMDKLRLLLQESNSNQTTHKVSSVGSCVWQEALSDASEESYSLKVVETGVPDIPPDTTTSYIPQSVKQRVDAIQCPNSLEPLDSRSDLHSRRPRSLVECVDGTVDFRFHLDEDDLEESAQSAKRTLAATRIQSAYRAQRAWLIFQRFLNYRSPELQALKEDKTNVFAYRSFIEPRWQSVRSSLSWTEPIPTWLFPNQFVFRSHAFVTCKRKERISHITLY